MFMCRGAMASKVRSLKGGGTSEPYKNLQGGMESPKLTTFERTYFLNGPKQQFIFNKI